VAGGFAGAIPSSFNTQMALAAGGLRRDVPNQDMLSKLVLARMNNIEEGFREVIKEVKDLARGGSSRSRSRSQPDQLRAVGREKEKKKRGEKKDPKKRRPNSEENQVGRDGKSEEA
jgi:hypothetical protein